MTTVSILAVLATLALGVVVGLLYLQRVRRKKLVTAHLVLALSGTALVLVLLARGGGGFGLWPLGLLVLALAAGWFASRLRTPRRVIGWMLASHVAAGVAGFLVLLAWIKQL